MNDSFLGNCVEANCCLNFDCKCYGAKVYTPETVPGPTWCDKMVGGEIKGKLVFIRPLVETQVVELEEMEGIVEGK